MAPIAIDINMCYLVMIFQKILVLIILMAVLIFNSYGNNSLNDTNVLDLQFQMI
jgi:hypothetical protein